MGLLLVVLFALLNCTSAAPVRSESQILQQIEEIVNGEEPSQYAPQAFAVDDILPDGMDQTSLFPSQNSEAPTSKLASTSIRAKRALRPPKHIADLLKISDTNPGLSGEVLYVARKACHVNFTISRKMFRRKDILKAELHVYKKPLKKTTNIWRKKTVHAVVSIHQVIVEGEAFGSTKMIDSRLVRVDDSGWIKFDITDSVKEWLKYRHSNKGLDIWVESIKPGDKPAKVARRFKFECSDTKDQDKLPGIAIFFTEDGKRRHRTA